MNVDVHLEILVAKVYDCNLEPVAFTIIIPVYNGARYLQQALDSVADQTLFSWECLIIDDGSQDGSYAIASRWASTQGARAKVMRHPDHGNHGVAVSRNVALRESMAQWIAFLDQDDVWMPGKLEDQAEFIQNHPEIAAVGCLPELSFDGVTRLPFIENWVTMIHAIDEEQSLNLQLADFVAGCPFCMSGVVARKSDVMSLGGFDNSLGGIADWLMWACLASRSPLGLVRKVLVKYRVHGDNDLLRLLREPLGVAQPFLQIRSRLVSWIMDERAYSYNEANNLVNRLISQSVSK